METDPTDVNKTSMLALPVLLAVVASAITFGGFGYYFGQQQNQSFPPVVTPSTQQQTSRTSVQTENPKPTTTSPSATTPARESSEPIIPTGWTTYTNSELGYQAAYPAGWRIEAFRGTTTRSIGGAYELVSDNIWDGTEGLPSGIFVNVRANPTRLSAKGWAEQYPGAPRSADEIGHTVSGEKISSPQSVTIDQTEAAQLALDSTAIDGIEGADILVTYVPVGDRMYIIHRLQAEQAIYASFLGSFHVSR